MPKDIQKLLLEIADRLDSIKRTRGEVPFYQLPPFEFDRSVPPVTEVEKLSESQDIGVTHLALRFIRPTDNNIDHFEIWAKNVSFGSDQPYKVADVINSPASINLKADSATDIVLFIRTIMKNGLATDLNSSPTIATSVETDPAIIAGDLADGSVGDDKLDRITDPITILTADIGNAQITNALIANLAVGTAQIIDLAVDNAKINDLAAAKILAGTMIAVNMTAGTFELVSTPNTMKINGTDGFLQNHSTSGHQIKIKDGFITGEHSTNGKAFDIAMTTLTGDTSALAQFYVNGSVRAAVGVNAPGDAYGRVSLAKKNATTVVARLEGNEIGGGQTDSGHLAVMNSSGTDRAELGVGSGGDGEIHINGLRVITTRKAGPLLVSGTAGATYGSTERDLINDLRAAVNILRDALRITGGHGLITEP